MSDIARYTYVIRRSLLCLLFRLDQKEQRRQRSWTQPYMQQHPWFLSGIVQDIDTPGERMQREGMREIAEIQYPVLSLPIPFLSIHGKSCVYMRRRQWHKLWRRLHGRQQRQVLLNAG